MLVLQYISDPDSRGRWYIMSNAEEDNNLHWVGIANEFLINTGGFESIGFEVCCMLAQVVSHTVGVVQFFHQVAERAFPSRQQLSNLLPLGQNREAACEPGSQLVVLD